MKKYIPDLHYQNIFAIPYFSLKEKGIRNLLFDLDNTIAKAHEKTVSYDTLQLFCHLKKEGFSIVIVSNSPKRRVALFASLLEVPVSAMSLKPFPIGFKRVFSKHHFIKRETAMIGDQILTDIVGGNTFGIMTILVTPISSHDFFLTKVNRYFENRIIKKLEKKNLWKEDVYDK